MSVETTTNTLTYTDVTTKQSGKYVDSNGYVGLDLLTSLLGPSKIGQYWNGNEYEATWRNGDNTTLTTNEFANNSKISVWWDNYRYIFDSSFRTSTPSDVNRFNSSILQSSTAGNTVTLQTVGESQVLYALTDTTYGSGTIHVDNVLQGTYNWTAAPTQTTIATMESTETWTGSGVSADLVNFKQGSQSIKLNASGASSTIRGLMVYGAAQDFTANSNDYIKCWVYIVNPANVQYVQLLFDSSSSSTSDFTKFAYENFSENLVAGWNELIVKRSETVLNGSHNWASVYKVRLSLLSNTKGSCTASFDYLRFTTPVALFTKTGLTHLTDHTIKVTCTSGVVNIAYVAAIATKKALETHHRDTVLMVAPCHAALAAVNGSASDLDKATKIMETYRLDNQLGDRTAANRARFGNLGVGGTEQANVVSSSNYLDPGEATVTSGGFNGCMIGLTYLVLQKYGNSTAYLANWKACLQGLSDYWLNYLDLRDSNIYTYFNTGNAQLLWACTLYLTYLATGLNKYRDYAYASANSYYGADPADPFYHFFVHSYEDVLSNGNIRQSRGYLGEHEEETVLVTTSDGVMSKTATTISFTSVTAISLTTASTNFIVQIDNELIYCTTRVSGLTWNCTRAYMKSTAASHDSGAEISRGFDFGYARVQTCAAYMFGILTGDEKFKRLGRSFYNAIEDRMTPSTLAYDISGGSRNLVLSEGYWTSGVGINAMTYAEGNSYPDQPTVDAMLESINYYVTNYSFLPGDTIALTASNTVGTFATASYALGFVNCLKYLGYFDNSNG